MAPKKAAAKEAPKKDDKPKKPEVSAEMKELREKEKALVKVNQPDKTDLDNKTASIQKEIDGFQEKLQKLNQKIQDKSQGKEEHFRMKEDIRSKLDAFSAKIDDLEKKRSAIGQGMKDAKDAERSKQNEQRDFRRKLGLEEGKGGVEGIQELIRETEFKMQSESLTLKQEKELMQKIKDLKAAKQRAQKFEKAAGTDGPADNSGAKLSMDEIKEQLTEVREAKKLQSAAYAKLIEARNKVMGDVPELFKEREELNGQVRALYAKRNEARDEHYQADREYRAYQNEVRVIRNEKYKIERAERQKEWESTKGDREVEDTTVAEVPFFAELQYLDNMIRHLKTLLPKSGEAEEEKKAETKIDTSAAPGEVLLAKGAREEEFFFAPTKKKQLKKKGAGGKPKTLTHDLQTLAFFHEYKVAAPADVSFVPKTLEELAAKVEEFKVKQAKKIEDNAKKKAGGKDEEAAEAPKEEAAKEE